MNGVFQKTGRCLLILSLLLATGGHWAVLQSVAWSSMLIQYSRTASLGVALEQTFDSKHPCPLCKKIQQGKHDEKKQESQIAQGKLVFCYAPDLLTLMAPRFLWQLPLFDMDSSRRENQPLIPPPQRVFC